MLKVDRKYYTYLLTEDNNPILHIGEWQKGCASLGLAVTSKGTLKSRPVLFKVQESRKV